MSTETVTEAPQCFRHPGREAAVGCQRCGRLICSQCMVAAPVGFQCPECVTAARVNAPRAFAVQLERPYLTYVIIALNVLVALASLGSDEWVRGQTGEVALRGGLIGGRLAIIDGRAQVIGVDEGQWYRIFTGAFIHGGPIHLGFNMLVLWQIGMVLEPLLGRVRFGLVYVVSILGGSFGALLLQPDGLTVGASGGVFGLMGALFLAQRVGVIRTVGSSIGGLILINLVLTALIPGISVGGHIGGLAAGSIAGGAMFLYEKRRMPPTIPLGITCTLGLALFAGCLWAGSTWQNPLF